MSCQSTYSPPITLPTALPGSTGATGAAGADGNRVLINSSGTSSGTGNQSIVTDSMTGGTITQYDNIEYEAYCRFTTSYVGTVYFKLGTETILTHSIGANDVYTPPVGKTEFVLLLKARVTFKTTATEDYVSSIEAVEDSVTKVTNPLVSCTENSANALDLVLGCNPSAGTVTCDYFIVTRSKANLI